MKVIYKHEFLMLGTKDKYHCIMFTSKFSNAILIAQACMNEPKVVIPQHITTSINSTIKALVS